MHQSATTSSTIYEAVMLFVVAALGLAQSWFAVLVPFMGVLGGLMFAVIGLIYTSFLKSIYHVNYFFTLFVTPLFLFSGVFHPLDPLPQIVKEIAFFRPVYHLVRVIRPLFLRNVRIPMLLDLAWIIAFIAIFTVVPINLLRSKLVK